MASFLEPEVALAATIVRGERSGAGAAHVVGRLGGNRHGSLGSRCSAQQRGANQQRRDKSARRAREKNSIHGFGPELIRPEFSSRLYRTSRDSAISFVNISPFIGGGWHGAARGCFPACRGKTASSAGAGAYAFGV